MKKLLIIAASVMTVAGLLLTTANAQVNDTKYEIEVQGGDIEFNVFSGTLELWAITTSNTTGDHTTYNATYSGNSFVLEDLSAAGDDWHIDMLTTDLIGSSNTISKEQIYIKGAAVNVAAGAGPVSCTTDIDSVSTDWAVFADTSVELFSRGTVTDGSTCRVGTTLTMWVDVPRYQAVDTYIATITVTETAGATATLTYNPWLDF